MRVIACVEIGGVDNDLEAVFKVIEVSSQVPAIGASKDVISLQEPEGVLHSGTIPLQTSVEIRLSAGEMRIPAPTLVWHNEMITTTLIPTVS